MDLVGRDVGDVDVVLAGDVCYESETSARMIPWLRRLARGGRLVLLADPGRAYVPTDGVEPVAAYDIPTSRELESDDRKRTTIWRVLP